MGSGPFGPFGLFGLEDKAPLNLWMFNLEDLQTLNIPTNKKLEVWTQYRLLLSLVATSLLSRKFWGKNPEKSQDRYD